MIKKVLFKIRKVSFLVNLLIPFSIALSNVGSVSEPLPSGPNLSDLLEINSYIQSINSFSKRISQVKVENNSEKILQNIKDILNQREVLNSVVKQIFTDFFSDNKSIKLSLRKQFFLFALLIERYAINRQILFPGAENTSTNKNGIFYWTAFGSKILRIQPEEYLIFWCTSAGAHNSEFEIWFVTIEKNEFVSDRIPIIAKKKNEINKLVGKNLDYDFKRGQLILVNSMGKKEFINYKKRKLTFN